MTNDGGSSIVSESTIRETTLDLADGPNVRELIFDDTNNEKPPFVLDCGCCCTKQLQCDRAFTFLLLQYSTIFAVILFCISYLILAPANKYIVRCTCYSFSERRLHYSSPIN